MTTSVGASKTRVIFWGVRGSIPTPGPGTVRYGGNTSCVEVRAEGEIIILDAGSGIRLLGQSLQREFGSDPIRLAIPSKGHLYEGIVELLRTAGYKVRRASDRQGRCPVTD